MRIKLPAGLRSYSHRTSDDSFENSGMLRAESPDQPAPTVESLRSVPELREHVTARAAEIRATAAQGLRELSSQINARELVAVRDDSAEEFRRLAEQRYELWQLIRTLEGKIV